MTFLKQAAVLLGGHVSNGQILCPGPNHKPGDRSLSIKFDPNHSDGFVCYSYAGDDWEVCRAHIKSKIDHLLPFCDVQSDQANIVQIQTLTASSDEGLYEAASDFMGGRNPDHIFLYRDETGQGIIQANVRWDDINGEKAIRPFLFTDEGWKCRATPKQRPLYNLDQIVSNPESDVLIVEGEKAAEAASLFFPGVVSTWAGGARAVGKTDFSILAGRKVSLWPDNDSVGQRAMLQVAEILQQQGAEVRTVDLEILAQLRPKGPELSEGWDAADAVQEGWENGKIYDATISSLKTVAPVAPVAPSRPTPLFEEFSESEPYPVKALGNELGGVVSAIARKVQVPEAMAAQSVLSATSLIVQAHADVLLPFGQARPTSLFATTVAASGDRKSTADNEALKGVKRHEAKLRKRHREELREYEIIEAAYNAEKRRIEGGGLKNKRSLEERQKELRSLGPKPQKPILPLHTISDPTIEGLIKNMHDLRPSIGLFSNEGGQFMGSYGMTEEHRLKTAANLSACWDGEAIKRLRAGDGPTNIVGHRLSMHLMLQPEASQLLLGSGVLRDQGLLSRLLVSAVPSLAGTRFHREVDSLDEVTIEKFAEKTFKLLDLEPPLIEGSRNELEPRSLPLSKEAKALFYQYSDSLEAEMGKSGELANLKDIASKAPENALRISAVIALFENIAITEISHEMMKRGIKLMDWYLSEISRLYEIGRVDPQLISAQMLLSWIQAWAQKKDTNIVTERDIARNGPKSLRNAKSLKPIVKILCDHNWLIALGAKGYKLYKKED